MSVLLADLDLPKRCLLETLNDGQKDAHCMPMPIVLAGQFSLFSAFSSRFSNRDTRVSD